MNALISEPIAALAHHSRSELIETCLAAAAQSQAIYTRLYADGARACARHADAMRAANISPPSSLAGLPISIKDLLDVAGEATTAGSIVLKDAPPATKDAPVGRGHHRQDQHDRIRVLGAWLESALRHCGQSC